jgi:arylformamidase
MSFSSDPEIDKAYSPSRALPEGVFQAHMDLYRDRSLEVYRTQPHERDLRYDEASGQGLDIVPAPGSGLKPAFVFIHGGYWRMLSKDESVYMAPALNARGITLVAPDYSLAPATSLEEIVRQVRTAIVWLYRHGAEHGIDPERLFIGGHSAGGHLTGALVAGGWRQAFGLPENVIKGAMPVSGLFDLEPITRSFVNEWMGLDGTRSDALSPIFHLPPEPCRMVVAWGGAETQGFHDQSHAWLAAWRGAGFPAVELEVPGRHHFDIVLDWCDPDSAMTRALAAMVLGDEPTSRG